jgi:flagellar biogenesis protein FliO
MDLRDKLSSLSVSPQKILKIVIGLSVVLLLLWLLTLSQIDYSKEPDTGQLTAKKEMVDSTIVKKPVLDRASFEERSYSESSGIFTNGLVTFVVLLVILIGVWFWLGRKEQGTLPEKQREIDSSIIGEGAQLKIMRINNEVWVLGVTSGSVNLLHRYPENEWDETPPEMPGNGEDIFAQIFKNKMG